MLHALTFSLIEWLCLMGAGQCLLIFVYIAFRARVWTQVFPVLAYFFVLAAAFILQFALRLEDYSGAIRFALWCVWMQGPALCTLIVMQAAHIKHVPSRGDYLVLTFVPAALALAFLARGTFGLCMDEGLFCTRFSEWLYWLGAMAGAFALLPLWRRGEVFSTLRQAKEGRERYWLSISLVVINVLLILVMFLRTSGTVPDSMADIALVASGFAFVYLVTTAVFRVYPRPVQLKTRPSFGRPALTPSERVLADQVRRLLEVDKLYQETTLSRADMARELKVPEGTLSRVINTAFGKSFPRLINEFRVEDAKILLHDPNIPVHVVATESGFQSLASFNRVFRALTGCTPTDYRTLYMRKNGL